MVTFSSVLLLSLLKLLFVFGEDKSVIQSGQPTHFHMEDRGPEIQVTADNDGVKINAKPAGLNVVAKPGKIPATIPDSTLISHLEDIPGTSHYHGDLHRILLPVNTNPQLIHHSNEPVMYTGAINGMASRGDTDMQFNTNLGINPSIYPVPNQFNNYWSNGNLGPQILPPSFNAAAFPMQVPMGYPEYLGFHDAHHHHPHPHHHQHHGGEHHGRHRMTNNFYFPRQYDDDDDDDDDDYDYY